MEASPQEVKAFPAGNLYKLCPKLFSCFFAPSVLSYTSRWDAPKSKAVPKTQITSCYRMFIRRCVGMVDEEDSKSFGRDTVWVRVPPPAPQKRRMQSCILLFCDVVGLEPISMQNASGILRQYAGLQQREIPTIRMFNTKGYLLFWKNVLEAKSGEDKSSPVSCEKNQRTPINFTRIRQKRLPPDETAIFYKRFLHHPARAWSMLAWSMAMLLSLSMPPRTGAPTRLPFRSTTMVVGNAWMFRAKVPASLVESK